MAMCYASYWSDMTSTCYVVGYSVMMAGLMMMNAMTDIESFTLFSCVGLVFIVVVAAVIHYLSNQMTHTLDELDTHSFRIHSLKLKVVYRH
jgi:uncharacterized membrane protein YhdT